MNYYMGIDPGANGAVTVLGDKGWIDDICEFKKNTEHDIAEFIRLYSHEVFAYLEKMQPLPKKMRGGIGSFKIADSFGFLRGILTSQRIPYELVTPTKWQTTMKCKSGGDKNVTKAAAQRLFAREDFKVM